MHVLIAGGGLGGLALAQGLVKDGHTVEVFERDTGVGKRQGYYLTMNGDGGESLRRVLTEDLYELYLATSRQPYPTQASIVRTPQLQFLGAQPSLGTAQSRASSAHRGGPAHSAAASWERDWGMRSAGVSPRSPTPRTPKVWSSRSAMEPRPAATSW